MVQGRVRSVRVSARRLRWLAGRERHSPVPVPLPRRVALWRQGFLGESDVLYDLGTNPPADYLSDVARYVRSPYVNGASGAFLNDKVLFSVVASVVAPLPALLGLVDGGRYVPLAPGGPGPGDDGALAALTRLHGAVVVKPRTGGGGSGISILRADADGVVTRNGRPIAEAELEPGRFAGSQVVTAFVTQAAYARRIQPGTTNTVRVLTMVDPDTGRAFSPIAVHRFGSVRSGAVDNWTQGGLSALVDPESGEMGPGISFPRTGTLERHERHPDTGEQIAGVVVPGWPQVLAGVLRVADALSFIPYVGWDVIVTDDGFSIIEGNNWTDVNLLQVHRPLLRDERVRRFYRHHGVVGDKA